MAQDTELERLVVKFIGDASSFAKAHKEVNHGLKELGSASKERAKDLKELREAAIGFGETMLKYGAMAGVAFEAKEAYEAFEKFEHGAIKLNATLEANGRAVGATLAEYKQFAEGQERLTNISKNATMALLAQAETFQTTGSAATKAAKEAQALAALTGESAEAMMRVTTALAKGDIETAMMLGRLIPQLRGVRDEEQYIDRYNKLVAAGTKVLAEEAETAGGKIKRMKLTLEELQLQMGGLLTDALEPVANALKSAANWFNGLDEGTRKAVVSTAEMVAGVIALNAAVKALSLASTTNPIGLIVMGVYLAGRAIANLSGATEEYAGRVKAAVDAAKDLNNELARHPKDKLAIEGDIAATERKIAAEKARIKDTGVLLLTIGELMGETTKPMEKAVEAAKERLKELAEEEKRALTPAQMLTKQFEDLLKKINESASHAGMAAEEIERMKLAAKGLGDDQLDQLDAAISQRKYNELWHKLLEDWQMAGEDDKGKKYLEAIKTRAKGDDLKELFDLIDQADLRNKVKEIKDRIKTPQDKLAEEMKVLDKALEAGALIWDEYAKAADEARNRLLGVAAALGDATDAMGNAARVSRYEYFQALSGFDKFMKGGREFPQRNAFFPNPEDITSGGLGYPAGSWQNPASNWVTVPNSSPEVVQKLDEVISAIYDAFNSVGVSGAGG